MTQPPLLTRDFGLLVSGHFLQALGYSSMILLPVYLTWLGGNREQVGTIMAIAALGGLALRPLAGWSLDAIGRRTTVLVGTLVLGVGMGLIGLVDRIGPLVYVARLLIGAGSGTLFAAYFTYAADLVPPARRTEGIALFGISGLAPLALNPIVGRLGVDAPDLRWLFPIVGVLVMCSVLAVLRLREDSRAGASRPRGFANVRRALSRRALLPVWAATLVFAGLVALYMAFVTVTAANRGIPDPASMWLTYAVGAITVRLFGARLPERVGPHNMVAPAMACYAGAMLLAAQADGRPALLLSGLLAGVGHGYCFPVLTAQVVDRVDPALRGAGIAMFTALWDASGLALTPCFGMLADARGDASMFSAAALFAVTGLCAWVVLEARLGPGRSDDRCRIKALPDGSPFLTPEIGGDYIRVASTPPSDD